MHARETTALGAYSAGDPPAGQVSAGVLRRDTHIDGLPRTVVRRPTPAERPSERYPAVMAEALPASTLPRQATFPLADAGYLLPYALTSIIFVTNHLAGAYPFIGIIIGFVLIPILDYRMGVQTENLDPALEQSAEGIATYKILLWMWAPVQLGLTFYGMYRFSTLDLPLWARALMIVSAGIPAGGIGITIAHEVGHRSGFMDKLVARVLLGIACYMHFTVEHNRGHHINVATPKDPATARLGESFYAFYFRTVPGQWLSAWRLENERVRKLTGGRALSLRNQMIWFTAIPVVVGVLCYLWLGWWAVVFFYGQAFIAFSLLEAVNYLEHYGLLRKQLDDGKYERVTPLHSWNASYPVSNWLLFRLQRHADHHAYAARRFQILRHLPEGPQLPFGYPTMIPMTLIPPLWRWIMDKRVIAVRKASGTWTDADEARFGPTAHIPALLTGAATA
jgi:alkane 1-monooxygenase